MRVAIAQNARLEGPGRLASALDSDGHDVDIIDARREAIPADHDMLVVLGGPQSANDDLEYLRRQEELIRRYIARRQPVLGVCLGSQLIARALGARVYRGHAAEMGFYDDLRPTRTAGVFEGMADPFVAFHWHADTFELPRGATRLVGSSEYENQAFEAGSAVAVQFHLEAEPDTIRLWLESAPAGVDSAGILGDIESLSDAVASNFDAFYRNLRIRLPV